MTHLSMIRGIILILLVIVCAKETDCIGEILNPLISCVPPNAKCDADAFVRPCVRDNGVIVPSYPVDWPCPCHADGTPGGAIRGDGKASVLNPNVGQFVDKIVADGFTNPVGMAFADNTKDLFVITKEGVVWNVDLVSGVKQIFIDLQEEVGNAGDRGMLGVTTHPNFANNPFVFLLYTVDPIFGQPDEAMDVPANQRLIRLQNVNGVASPTYRINLIGGGLNDGIPICYNTHAIGSVKFGWDGSLFVTSGEGAHWDFDAGDFGQDLMQHDAECEGRFGQAQDVGGFRSQVFETLGGKLLRIKADTGEGICEGGGFPILNPFCDGNPNSIRSKIWATGLRNPFRMTVRPYENGDVPEGPGVVYFGDVGEGGYEEVNAVTGPGLNFGWPCWEGPYPQPKMRDSPINYAPNTTAQINGTKLTCDFMYKNMKTELPFYFWSRFNPNDDAGYYDENAYLGQGFKGNTVGGVVIYNGNKYPANYKGAVFMLDYSQWWIRVASRTRDIFTSVQDFYVGDGAMLTLEVEPIDGNVCFLYLNKGEVHCFVYNVQNVPPTPNIRANPQAGLAPLAVQFRSDGTYDREKDPVAFQWNFGDAQPSSANANPVHNYGTPGAYTATLVVTDRFMNSANKSIPIFVGSVAPKVSITSPTSNVSPYFFAPNQTLQFQANAIGNNLVYRWELQIVHLNHIHTDQKIVTTPTFIFDVSTEGADSHGSERIDLRVEVTVTDTTTGLSAKDSILLIQQDWQEKFGANTPPVAAFTIDGYQPFQVEQPILFNGEPTIDINLDYIWYEWNFGDGMTGVDRFTSHAYENAGNFIVNLTVHDNFWGFSSVVQEIVVQPRSAVQPVISPPGGSRFATFPATMYSITQGSTIHFTIDGSTPTIASPIYVNPIIIPFVPYSSITIKSIAVSAGLQTSPVATNTFNIFPPTCSDIFIRNNCSLTCLNTETIIEPRQIITIPPAFGMNSVGMVPQDQSKVLRYLIDKIFGSVDQSKGTTMLHLYVDGGSLAGQAVQAKISYDWTNDGVWDRKEIFNLYACDPVADSFEEYTHVDPLVRFQPGGITGTPYQNFNNGSIQLEIWQAIGLGTPAMRMYMNGVGADGKRSMISIPYNTTSQTSESPCDLRCAGTLQEDICGVCAGPGLTGCDNKCFSTKVIDSCGACGGPGPTGCDFQCNSTKSVGTCGLCGVPNQNCVSPSPSCNYLAIRSGCPDLICNYLNWGQTNSVTIPPANGTASAGSIPSNPEKVLDFNISSIHGFYNIDDKATVLNLYVDAMNNPAHSLECAVWYDWTGDGIWDRKEIFDIFPPNDVPGFELMSQIGLPPPAGKLQSVVGGWNNLENGAVRLQCWSAFATTANAALYLRTDKPFNNQLSFIKIPFITSYRSLPYEGNGACGAVEIPPTTGTTGGMTTGQDFSTTGAVQSTTGTTGAISSTTGSSNACDNFSCGCTSNYTCPCVTLTCIITSNGQPYCQRNPRLNGTSCSVISEVCYDGTCVEGSCEPVTYLECNDQRPKTTSTGYNDSVISSANQFQKGFKIVWISLVLFLLLKNL